jgi:hypothetical protein
MLPRLPTLKPRVEKLPHLPKRRKPRHPRVVRRSRRPLNRLRKRRPKRNARKLKLSKLKLPVKRHSRRDSIALESSKEWVEEFTTSTRTSLQRGPNITSGSCPCISGTLQASQLNHRFFTCKCALLPCREPSWQTAPSLISVKFPSPSRRLKKY